jgi:hypothetical protein
MRVSLNFPLRMSDSPRLRRPGGYDTACPEMQMILPKPCPRVKAAAARAVPSAALTHGPVGLLCIYPGQVVLETDSKARPLLVARPDLLLGRDGLPGPVLWHMGAAVRYIVPQRRS